MAIRGDRTSATALSRPVDGARTGAERLRALRTPLRIWSSRHLVRRATLGQSLVEFALVLPIMLLLTLAALDLGRVYLGWINLQNAARAASNFAANNPEAWLTNDTATITEYRNQVINDTAATNCVLNPGVPADPTFTDGNGDGNSTSIGDRVSVSFTCSFSLITPVIAHIVGQTVNVSASAVFPIKDGQFAVSGGAGPVASFTGSPTTTTTGTNVVFDSTASTGSPTTWSWTFGDGGTSSSQNPTHAYAAAGTYDVALTVTNGNGSNTQTRLGYITVSAPAPVANFTASTTTPAVSAAVSFTDTSSGSPTTWAWTFGDGGTSTSQNPAHAYNTPGTYSVSLTVTGPGGTNSITKTNYIIVSAATCTVPNFVGLGTRINNAQGIWNAAGFTTTIVQAAGHSSGNYKITFQSIVGGQVVACNSTITVNG
ncbi:MAG TPA: PKD domain-containing protein [Candidatus Limnocylindrales bacterium]|nr:PKD domain-containing protein [Candidatus Limnocylindrales bacterium]